MPELLTDPTHNRIININSNDQLMALNATNCFGYEDQIIKKNEKSQLA
jgi:hypothetical protein